MTEHRYILEPYKGMNTRYACPGCNLRDKTFVRYIDTQTGEHLHNSVGRCNREVNCGYHYTPKQYFQDNPDSIGITPQPKQYTAPKTTVTSQPKPESFIPIEVFQQSRAAYDENNFVQFLIALFDTETATTLIERYHIGTSKHWHGATVFWQIDISGKVRTGKIIQYEIINEEKSLIGLSCKRVKTNIPPVQWAHKLLKVEGYNLQQCFFAEHLLQDNTKLIALFESEKTAVIASVYFPEYICLATGGTNGCKWTEYSVAKVLHGRSVILFPDISKPDAKVNCFEDWSNKAKELSRLFPGTLFDVSDLLERSATEAERHQGLDLADYLIRFDPKEFQEAETSQIPAQYEPEAQEAPTTQPIRDVRSDALLCTENISQERNLNKNQDDWENEISELQIYFEGVTLLSAGSAKLNPYSTISGIPKFIQSHLAIVKANNGNHTFLPYLERLQELKQYLITSKKSDLKINQ